VPIVFWSPFQQSRFFLFQFFNKTSAMEIWSPHEPRWTPRCPQGPRLGLPQVYSYGDWILSNIFLNLDNEDNN